ncbi:hypothetical protein C8Q74DRAFT_1448888 [Fomes fomentarius]|nr:hypothetical protein C8Q74DRAFT_1448888 [Fomes fomentarius]
MLPISAPLHTTLTSGLVALCLTLILFGVILCQVFAYMRMYKSDLHLFKALVTAILIGETAHTALASYASYFYMVLNFGNWEVTSSSNLGLMVSNPSTLSFQPLILTINIVLCQYFFIRRLYYVLPHYLRRWYIFIASSVVAVASGLAIGKSALKACPQLGARDNAPLALTVELVVHNTYSEWIDYNWLVSACFAITAAVDIVILVGLVTSLHKSRTGIKRTDTLLDILIVYACSTGLVTCLLSTTCLLVNLLEGGELFIIPVSFVAAKIYAIAVLAVLNSRQTLAEKADGPLDTEWLGLSNLKFTVPRTEDHLEVGVHVLDNRLHSAQRSSWTGTPRRAST